MSESPSGKLTVVNALVSLAGACVTALAVPFVILAIGTPIALSVAAVVKAIGWLLA